MKKNVYDCDVSGCDCGILEEPNVTTLEVKRIFRDDDSSYFKELWEQTLHLGNQHLSKLVQGNLVEALVVNDTVHRLTVNKALGRNRSQTPVDITPEDSAYWGEEHDQACDVIYRAIGVKQKAEVQ